MANEQHRGGGTTFHPGGQPAGHKGIADTVSDAAGQVKDKVTDMASSVAHKAGDAWDATRHAVQDGASAVATNAEDAWTGFGNMISRYPIASVAVAFALGALCYSACGNMFSNASNMTRRMSSAG
jgi:ElaB/YqjD/DUF883 family membrane-anchored ribosome-binding protein